MGRAGPRYGSGSSHSGARGGVSGSIRKMFTRSHSHVPERVRDYNLGSASGLRQQRIDTGPWTSKGKTVREMLGKAWSKACHSVGIPG